MTNESMQWIIADNSIDEYELGRLYNCHDDRFIDGRKLWNIATNPIDKIQTKLSHCFAATDQDYFKLIFDDGNRTTNYQQLDALFNIQTKNTFLHSFLNNSHTTSHKQLCHLLKFDITTATASIDKNLLCNEKIDNRMTIAHANTATHVVTSITFGADIYCILRTDITNSEQIEAKKTMLSAAVEYVKDIVRSNEQNIRESVINLSENELNTIQMFIFTDLPAQKGDSMQDNVMSGRKILKKHIDEIISKPNRNVKSVELFQLGKLVDHIEHVVMNIADSIANKSVDAFYAYDRQFRQLQSLKFNFPNATYFESMVRFFCDYIKECQKNFAVKMTDFLVQFHQQKQTVQNLVKIIEEIDESYFGAKYIDKYIDLFMHQKTEMESLTSAMTNDQIDHIINVDQLAEKSKQKPILLLKYHYADFNKDIRLKYIKIESSFRTGKFEKFKMIDQQWFEQFEHNARWIQIFCAFTEEKRNEITKEKRNEMHHFYQLLSSDAMKNRENIIEMVYYQKGFGQSVRIPIDLDVQIKTINDTAMVLVWTAAAQSAKYIKHFEIYVNKTNNNDSNNSQQKWCVQKNDSIDLYEKSVPDLLPLTQYRMQVDVITEFGKLPNTVNKNIKLATTKQRKAHFICESAQLDSEQPLKIYVPKKEIIEEFRPDKSDNSKMGKIQRFNIGRPKDGKENQNIKTIMMFGRTGHGKTTMISAMLNYLYEVNIDDSFRFRIISKKEVIEERENKGSSSSSQTRHITAYELDSTLLPYRLVVVDMPGFGDTKNHGEDEWTTQMVKSYFKDEIGNDRFTLDAVCLVMRSDANDAMLNVLNRIMTHFSIDFKNNLVPLFTFAGRGDRIHEAQNVLQRQNITFQHSFNFENGCIFAGNKDNCEIRDQWSNVMTNFKDFFKLIDNKKPGSFSNGHRLINEHDSVEEAAKILHKHVEDKKKCLKNIEEHIEQLKTIRSTIFIASKTSKCKKILQKLKELEKELKKIEREICQSTKSIKDNLQKIGQDGLGPNRRYSIEHIQRQIDHFMEERKLDEIPHLQEMKAVLETIDNIEPANDDIVSHLDLDWRDHLVRHFPTIQLSTFGDNDNSFKSFLFLVVLTILVALAIPVALVIPVVLAILVFVYFYR